jgi:hypothetical protein
LATPGTKRRGTSGSTKVRISSRTADLLEGKIAIGDLDDEELARGQLRDNRGTFSGRPPALIPRAMQQAMYRELLRRGEALVKDSFLEAIERVTEIAKTCPDPAVSLKAATYVWERLAGKIPDKVEISADVKPWQGVVEGVDFADDFEDASSVPDQKELESRKTAM